MRSMMRYLASIFLLGVISMTTYAQNNDSKEQVAIFAGGCFWCEEQVFEKHEGVISVISGYTGGNVKNPTYEQVSDGGTGHLEGVKVVFDPDKITYEKLLDLFWHNVDPFDPLGQFCDKGTSYKAVIFYSDENQKKLADASKKKWEEHFKKPIVTEIKAASEFYPAEDYHQDYATKNPLRYSFYRRGCGRDARLEEIWGKSTE